VGEYLRNADRLLKSGEYESTLTEVEKSLELEPGNFYAQAYKDRINALPDPVEARKAFIARQPMGRLGTTDDIIPLLIYLASDESSFATGVAFSVDGGMTI
jgi:NAD(P)-dependent dehydrogenase (short-subunit alcohol dehydrogenase family)